MKEQKKEITQDNTLKENRELIEQIEKLKADVARKNLVIKQLAVDNNLYAHSIRYRLGDVLIKALRPSMDTAKLPVRVLKLFWEGLCSKKNPSNITIRPGRKIKKKSGNTNYITDASLTKEKLSSYIEQTLDKNKKGAGFEDKLIVIISISHTTSSLKRLLHSIKKNVKSNKMEVFVLYDKEQDINSIINSYQDSFLIRTIERTREVSIYSYYNSIVKQSEKEYLLFLDDNIELSEGCINELFNIYITHKEAGVVGSVLFNYERSPIQHCGVRFKWSEGNVCIEDYLKDDFAREKQTNVEGIQAIKKYVLLIQKDKFLQAEGFSKEFFDEYGDIDLCLKLLKKGYKNYISPIAFAYYHEDEIYKPTNVRKNKKKYNDKSIFGDRWNQWLQKQYRLELFKEKRSFFMKPVKVVFAVTSTDKNTGAGDYFTALEFGEAMKKRGWLIEFLEEEGGSDWYNVNQDVDILITLLPSYDVRKVRCNNKGLVTVAWARNWFESWSKAPSIKYFSYVLASSEIACEYMQRLTGREVKLLKIATNKDRFYPITMSKDEYKCDYCFTGSYWDDAREIINMLNPQEHPNYTFNIYGKNWNKVDKFVNHYKGFVQYNKMPEIYSSTKIVIDDANRVTKPFGAVNSRVFDALASGVLVITNGILGAELNFNSLLPTYSNSKELNYLISYYLSNEEKRSSLVKELQRLVLENHTYDKRVEELIQIIEDGIPKESIIIKTPVPNAKVASEWGDYHFAVSMVKEFQKIGYEAELQFLDEWNKKDSYADTVIVLRGLNRYQPKDYHYNIMWNISHPAKVDIDEYYSYDRIYIASESWAEHIKNYKKNNYTQIEVLLQCTDPEIFKPAQNNTIKYELLFVGNSRNVFRKIIKDLLPTQYDLSVYGTKWEKIIPIKYVKGKNIPNKELYKHYAGAKIVLNDHWDDMRMKGFISNRIFDVLACKGFVISDEVEGIHKCFANLIVTYKDKKDLDNKISFYMNNEETRKMNIEEAYKVVLANHTFAHRIKIIAEKIRVNNY